VFNHFYDFTSKVIPVAEIRVHLVDAKILDSLLIVVNSYVFI